MVVYFRNWARLSLVAASLAGTCAGQVVQPLSSNNSWKFMAGLGVVSQPKYPGSGEMTQSALPLISADKSRYFIGATPGAGLPAGVGAYLFKEGPWRMGIGLGGELKAPRQESYSPRLHGLGNVDATALASLFGNFDLKSFGLRTSATTDVGGQHQGTRLTLDIEGRCNPAPNILLTAGPGLTWADSHYTQTFFGVNAWQSARSGMPFHSAGSGINLLRFSAGAVVRLTPKWGIGLNATLADLRGDAADSPITERRAQNICILYGSYRF